MASIVGATKLHRKLQLDYSTSQDVAGNKSTVSWTLYFVTEATYSVRANPCSGSVNINGTVTSFTANPTNEGGAKLKIAYGTTAVAHNADGSKSCGVSFVYNLKITTGSGELNGLSGSGTINFPKIARASTMSWAAADSPHEFGKTQHFTVTAASASYYHGVELRVNGSLVQPPLLLDSQGGGTKSLVIPLNIMDKYPNTARATGISFRLITYTQKGAWHGLIGYKDYPLPTCNVPESVVPTISALTASDETTTIPADLGIAKDAIYIEDKSVIRFDAGFTATYSSPIASCKVTIDTMSATSTTNTVDLNLANYSGGSGTKTATVVVTDKRGRSATKTATIIIVPYKQPVISKFIVERGSSDGTTALVTKTVAVSKIVVGGVDKNISSIKTEYKPSTLTNWTPFKTETPATSAQLAIAGVAGDKSYDVRITLTDAFSTTVSILSVPTISVLMNFHGDKNVGIGKMWEEGHGALDVADMIYMAGMSLVNYFLPVGRIITTRTPENPGLLYVGTTWERHGNGRVTVPVDESDTALASAGIEGGSTNPLSEHTHKQIFSNSATAILANLGSARSPLSNYLNKTGEGAAITSAGNNANHANWQPFITEYEWIRTA